MQAGGWLLGGQGGSRQGAKAGMRCHRFDSGKVVCDLLTRESHKWIYVCNDKDYM